MSTEQLWCFLKFPIVGHLILLLFSSLYWCLSSLCLTKLIAWSLLATWNKFHHCRVQTVKVRFRFWIPLKLSFPSALHHIHYTCSKTCTSPFPQFQIKDHVHGSFYACGRTVAVFLFLRDKGLGLFGNSFWMTSKSRPEGWGYTQRISAWVTEENLDFPELVSHKLHLKTVP